jgi:hypothetical protein
VKGRSLEITILALFIFLMSQTIFLENGVHGSESEGQPVLTLGGVDPGRGNSSTIFTFFITYKHPDGIVPENIFLVIGSNSYVMTALGKDHSAGVLYEVSLSLQEGEHDYYFITSASENTARFPDVGDMQIMVEDRDFLSLTGSSMVVEPDGRMHRFTTVYRDTRNLPPGIIQVRVDNVSYDLHPEGDNWTGGVNFSANIDIGPGEHNYYFFTSNSGGSYQDPREGGRFYHFDVEAAIPMIIIEESHVVFPDGTASFELTICEGDHSPVEVHLLIDGSDHVMGRIDIGNGNHKHTTSQFISRGSHPYHYELSWSWGASSYPYLGELMIERDVEKTTERINEPPNAVENISFKGKRVTLDASKSYDRDGFITGFVWEIDGKPHLGSVINIDLKGPGYHYGYLTVSDDRGMTDSSFFDFWYLDGLSNSTNSVEAYFGISDTGNPVKKFSRDDLKVTRETDNGEILHFSLTGSAEYHHLIVMDIPCSVISCFNETGFKVLVDGTTLVNYKPYHLITSNEEHEAFSLIKKDECLQVIFFLNLSMEREIRFIPDESEDKTSGDHLELGPILTLGSIMILAFILIGTGLALLLRTRINGGPRNPHEDFILSGGGIINGSMRKKKIEWEAYLEE